MNRSLDTIRPVLPDLSIRQLEYLVAVADSDTWANAAAAVGVSPSALSQGLAELERRVGVPLFERHGRRRILRIEARVVLDHARQVVGLTGDLARWAERQRSGSIGRVRLGMIDAAATIHHAIALRSFRTERPDVELHLTVAPSNDLLDRVSDGRLDAAITVEPVAGLANVEVRPILDEELAVFAPPGTRATTVADWGPWVLFPTTSQTRAVVTERLQGLGARVDVVAESHQPDVLAEMVRLDLGWTVLPTAQAARESPALTHVRPLGTRRLVIARRTGGVHSPALDDLLDRLRAETGTAD